MGWTVGLQPIGHLNFCPPPAFFSASLPFEGALASRAAVSPAIRYTFTAIEKPPFRGENVVLLTDKTAKRGFCQFWQCLFLRCGDAEGGLLFAPAILMTLDSGRWIANKVRNRFLRPYSAF
ncbi:hypothetical protein CO615_08050 [Lysobacteraceae bacterium NML75-0749]|nr:hypothetical protein CO615_08050 [Xanthomonadaceae bacterium NML75-0749]PJK03306.1 hypothetical protein CO612_09140 [Xanthomonadaceae bacterium NML71-0210]PJK05745.1 hypothetical protein CO609_01980 [Xanthomonadaceae bacterium NML91-0268]